MFFTTVPIQLQKLSFRFIIGMLEVQIIAKPDEIYDIILHLIRNENYLLLHLGVEFLGV